MALSTYFSRRFRLTGTGQRRPKSGAVRKQEPSPRLGNIGTSVDSQVGMLPIQLQRRHLPFLTPRTKKGRVRRQPRTPPRQGQLTSAPACGYWRSQPTRRVARSRQPLFSRHAIPARRQSITRRGGTMLRRVVAASQLLSGGSRRARLTPQRDLGQHESRGHHRLGSKSLLGHRKARSVPAVDAHSRSLSRPQVRRNPPMWSSISYPRPQMLDDREVKLEIERLSPCSSSNLFAAVWQPTDRLVEPINAIRASSSATPWSDSHIVLSHPNTTDLRRSPETRSPDSSQKRREVAARPSQNSGPRDVISPACRSASQRPLTIDSASLTICAQTVSTFRASDTQSEHSMYAYTDLGRHSQDIHDEAGPFEILPKKLNRLEAAAQTGDESQWSVGDACAVIWRNAVEKDDSRGDGTQGSRSASSPIRAQLVTPPRPTSLSQAGLYRQRPQSGRFPTFGARDQKRDTLDAWTTPSEGTPARRNYVDSSPIPAKQQQQRSGDLSSPPPLLSSSPHAHRRLEVSPARDSAARDARAGSVKRARGGVPLGQAPMMPNALPAQRSLPAAAAIRSTVRSPPPAAAAATISVLSGSVSGAKSHLPIPAASQPKRHLAPFRTQEEWGSKGQDEKASGGHDEDDGGGDGDGEEGDYRCVTEEILREYGVP